MDQKTLLSTIHSAAARGVHLIDPSVLSASIGSIGLKDPLVLPPEASLQICLEQMQKFRVGSVLITDSHGKLIGIVTERDFLMKVAGKVADLSACAVRDFMTKDPARDTADASLAFALSLMSHGGFRHVPIVDQDNVPIGMVSAKDVVDFFVQKMLEGIFEAVDLEP
jgi:CBS domain-containing protein